MQQQVQGYRISPQQRRLWKWGQESAYRDSMTQITAVLSGLLDDELFQAALEEVVRRNEILRSQFQMVPGMAYPVQVVLDAVSVELHVHDWRGASVAEQQAWADELMRANLQQPFELASGPLFRFERAMFGEGRQFLLLSTPAMCMDEKGLHNVLAELIACYVAGAKQTQEEDLPVPYSAVSEWWNELLESKDGESGRGFWKQQVQLEELTNSRLLPEQRVSEEKTTAVRSLHVSLDSDVNKQMEMAAHASGGSLETFLHVAWQVLLQKITGQENIVIGTACDGRMEEEIVGVPGLFARYIPIRSLAQPHQTYQETLQMTEQTMREAYVLHETFGWEQFNREDMVEEPYFPFGFDYLSAQVVAGGGLSISPLSATSCIDRFDVRLSVLQVADGLQIKIYFDVNRYSEQEMQHVLNAYAALLKHAVSAPDRAVAELGLLDESECRQLLAS
ncbi:MAG: condensation domain-containing protein, partial [Tumebacillaceae bacterium]